MKRFNYSLLSTLSLMSALLSIISLPVYGDELMAVDTQALTEFSKLIRWSGVVTSVFVITIAWFLLRFVHKIVDRISEQFALHRLLLQKLETVFQFTVYILTSLLVFNLCLRADDRVLALIGGTLAVSVDFSMKDLVASFIAGIMIMIDRPFQVGDRVSFDGHYGDIASIGLRSVRMRTLNDDIVTIPNNKFLSESTVSGNFGDLDMHVGMNFYIGLDQDVELARSIISEAAASSRYIHLPKPITVLITQVMIENCLAIKLRLKAYVLDTRYEKLFETDVNLRVIKEFNQTQIQPPAIIHRNISSTVPQEET